MPTTQTTNPMALKLFPHTIIISEDYQMEGISNRVKIEKVISNYFSSCNSEQLKNIAKEVCMGQG